MKKKIVMLMLAAALAATAVAGCSKNNTSQEQDIASDAQEATMPDGAIDEAFGQPSEDETGDGGSAEFQSHLWCDHRCICI